MSLQLISDNPIINGENDILYKDFINNIFNEILNLKKENTPFVIGINGKWGTGKTSIMKVLKTKIDETKESYDKRVKNTYITVWFESWKYNTYELIGNSLIYHLFSAITLSDKAFFKIRPEFYSELVELMKEIPLLKNIANFSDKAYKMNKGNVDLSLFEKSFKKALEIISEKIDKIIIFVDDLDRCNKDALMSFFEYIKLHINIPGVVFVIGMDKENVIKELSGDENEKHDEKYYKEYLEKIVQHWYDVPYLKNSEKIIYLLFLIREFHKGQKEKIVKFLANDLIKKKFFNWSPRKIKQFVNKLIVKYNFVKDNVEFNKLLFLVFFDFAFDFSYIDFIKYIGIKKRNETFKTLDIDEFIEKIKKVSKDELDEILKEYNLYDKKRILEKYFKTSKDELSILELKQGEEEDLIEELFGKHYSEFKYLNIDLNKKDIDLYFSRITEFEEIIMLLEKFDRYSKENRDNIDHIFKEITEKIKSKVSKLKENDKCEQIDNLLIYYYYDTIENQDILVPLKDMELEDCIPNIVKLL